MVQEVLQRSPLQEANLPLPIQLMPLPRLSFVPWFLQPSHPGCLFLLLSHPLQGTGTVAWLARAWVLLAFQPDRFLVLIHGIAMQTVTPTKKGELVQSGNEQPEVENVQVGLRSPASTCKAAAWIACSS